MAYSCDIAKLLAEQLAKFVTLNRHQLAGHVGNLDFWLAEVRHALDVIDGYSQRFRQLKAGWTQYVAEHKTAEFSLRDPDGIERPAAPPRPVPDGDLRDARRLLRENAHRFLTRCCREGLISEATLRSSCESLGLDHAM